MCKPDDLDTMFARISPRGHASKGTVATFRTLRIMQTPDRELFGVQYMLQHKLRSLLLVVQKLSRVRGTL